MINRHSLYGGMIRKNIIAGIPVTLLGFLIVFGVLSFIATKAFTALFYPVPLWGIAFLICLKDPDLLHIVYVRYLVLPPQHGNKSFWNGRSYLP